MSTCRKLRVTSRLPSSRPDDVTTPSFWCLSELLHIVFTHKLNLWYITALFAVMNLSPFYLSVSQTAGQWTPVSTHPRNQFPMQTSRYYSILISVLVAESSKLGFYIRQVIVEPESSAYPPQSCPFGGCVHVPITAPSTPGTGLLGKTPTYPTSYRNPMVLHCPCVTVYILISIASF